MRSTLLVFLATLALAVVLGPPAMDAIKGQSNVEAGPSLTARDAKGTAASPAGSEDSNRTAKRRDRDDDDD